MFRSLSKRMDSNVFGRAVQVFSRRHARLHSCSTRCRLAADEISVDLVGYDGFAAVPTAIIDPPLSAASPNRGYERSVGWLRLIGAARSHVAAIHVK
jgi:hypothetical protein